MVQEVLRAITQLCEFSFGSDFLSADYHVQHQQFPGRRVSDPQERVRGRRQRLLQPVTEHLHLHVWVHHPAAGLPGCQVLCGFTTLLQASLGVRYCVDSPPCCRSHCMSGTVWIHHPAAGLTVCQVLCGYTTLLQASLYVRLAKADLVIVNVGPKQANSFLSSTCVLVFAR